MLWTQISLKMLSFLTRLSVFEDQYAVEKPRVMRIEWCILRFLQCFVKSIILHEKLVWSQADHRTADCFRRGGITVEVYPNSDTPEKPSVLRGEI